MSVSHHAVHTTAALPRLGHSGACGRPLGMKCGSAVLPILASLLKPWEARCLASLGPFGAVPGPVWVSRWVWSWGVSGLVRFSGAANILCSLTGTRLAIRFFLKSFLK